MEFAASAEETFILTVFDLVNHLTKHGEQIAQAEGLTVQQWLLMLQVAGDPNFPKTDPSRTADGPVLASGIASARGVSRPSISTLVTSLVQRGLLTQEEDPRDRRQKTLRVTSAGLEVLSRIEPARHRANTTLLADFDRDELARALDVLRRCLDALRDHDRRPPGAETEVEGVPVSASDSGG